MSNAYEILSRYDPEFPRKRAGRLLTDTTEFMNIGYGDVIELDGKYFLVLRDEKERSFGVEDPKYWVKRCRELSTGDRKILKLVFFERFPVSLGTMEIECFRSPRKEARILDLVRGDGRFMQGYSRDDTAGNNIRVLDVVQGDLLSLAIDRLDADHKTYCFELLPDILEKFSEACRAIEFLHRHGENHGDIRRDHLWLEQGTGNYVWIDFDYTYEFQENPFGLDIFGLGNLLLFLVGKKFCTTFNIPRPGFDGLANVSLETADFSLLFKNRLANLRKVYPYVPPALNNVLMHFSCTSEVFYFTIGELLEELLPAIDELRRGRINT
jgi:hypothetical protein